MPNSCDGTLAPEKTAELRHLHPVDPVRGGALQQTVPDAEPVRAENRIELHEDLEGVNTSSSRVVSVLTGVIPKSFARTLHRILFPLKKRPGFASAFKIFNDDSPNGMKTKA
ncbi:hypothetical protein EYF80_036377 [Liparis tanakae]|uniref:Uncharacterized protein n=1 Tax=Liparis tanakae TaxID=230148 RepID=A0A4Z2GJI0_9TELE|nr:hypothetical protein EYF80_036377 [Liparis tanakae]